MKNWNISLDVAEIRKLKDEIDAYKNSLDGKLIRLINRLGEVGITTVETTLKPEKDIQYPINTYFEVHQRKNDCYLGKLVVQGEEILFLEFGTGVKFNGNAGSSPHPYGGEYGYTIGDYGKKKGRNEGWWYYDINGESQYTNGIKAQMPVYKANIKMVMTFMAIVKEIFGE